MNLATQIAQAERYVGKSWRDTSFPKRTVFYVERYFINGNQVMLVLRESPAGCTVEYANAYFVEFDTMQ
jgi:hypothetical protein